MRTVLAGLILSLLVNASSIHAASLLNYDTVYEANGYPNDQTLHGWQFLVNQPINITHLGLFDDLSDGFDIPSPIGLIRVTDGTLLTSGTISAGVVNSLINGFRYVDVPDVALAIGEEYVLAYYTDDPSRVNRDHVIATWGGRTVDASITLGFGRWGEGDGLALPENVDLRGVYFVGPNALFTPVPIPAVGWLLGPALAVFGWLTRKTMPPRP